jgi:hypothetical protein
MNQGVSAIFSFWSQVPFLVFQGAIDNISICSDSTLRDVDLVRESSGADYLERRVFRSGAIWDHRPCRVRKNGVSCWAFLLKGESRRQETFF